MLVAASSERKSYHQPIIEFHACTVEESISNSSATLTFGEINENYSPDIEDWADGSKSNSDYEF